MSRLLIAVVLAAPLRAQPTCARPDSVGAPIPLCALANRPTWDSTSRAPRFPDILLSAGVAGRVRARVVLDTTGRIEPRPVILNTTHALFESSLKGSIAAMRFSPGRDASGPVRTAMELEVEFANVAPKSDEYRRVARSVNQPWGIRIVNGIEGIPDGEPRRAISADEALIVRRLVLQHLMLHRDSLPVICLPADLDPDDFRDFTKQKVLRASDCPPSYDAMFASLDSSGRVIDRRPKGALDPFRVDFPWMSAWGDSFYLIRVDVRRGLGRSEEICEVSREQPGGPLTVRCLISRFSVS